MRECQFERHLFFPWRLDISVEKLIYRYAFRIKCHRYPWTFLLRSDFMDFRFMFVRQREYAWIRTEITPKKTAHRYTAKGIFICGVWERGNDTRSLWFLQGKNPQLVYVNPGMLPKSIFSVRLSLLPLQKYRSYCLIDTERYVDVRAGSASFSIR